MVLGLASSAQKSQAELDKLSEKYNETVMHHISNANEFHVVGDIHIPLPCILYAPDQGLNVFMSSKFDHGSKAIHGYVLDHGVVKRIVGYDKKEIEMPLDEAHEHGHGDSHGDHNTHDKKDGHSDHGHDNHNDNGHDADHSDHGHDNHDEGKGEGEKPEEGKKDKEGDHHYVYIQKEVTENGDTIDVSYVNISGKPYKLEKSSILLPGYMTSWYDFSISKNVFSMLLAALLMIFLFTSIARAYKKRDGKAPKGLQSFMEPIILFMRDEVTKPAIGPKWERYFPFILSLFFFILINNIFGIIPFFPFSSNVTGNVSTTLALAVFTFIVVNLSGNKHYWEHIFWMPGVPVFVKPILAVIEFAGIFIKPFTLFIRLFANITAGHIIILSLVGLVWMFGNYGDSLVGSGVGGVVAFLFVGFINLLELFVAFLQAFIFALLSALYIGMAIEEHHHDEHHEHAHEHAAAH
jgi:F-type H+-transporting ATPase subunit a